MGITTARVERVIGKLNSFDSAKEHYLRSTDLSAEGKRKALANVEAERTALRGEAVKALAEAWDDVRLKWGILQLKNDIEEQKQGRSWDYARLSYLSDSVRERVQHASSPSDVAKWYVPMLNSGDRHIARASAEAGAQAIRSRFRTDLEGVNLALQGEQKLKELTDSPVYHEVQAGMEQLIRDAVELQDKHDFIQRQLVNYVGLDSTADFEGAREGITITQSFDSDRAMFKTTLDVNEGQAVPA